MKPVTEVRRLALVWRDRDRGDRGGGRDRVGAKPERSEPAPRRAGTAGRRGRQQSRGRQRGDHRNSTRRRPISHGRGRCASSTARSDEHLRPARVDAQPDVHDLPEEEGRLYRDDRCGRHLRLRSAGAVGVARALSALVAALRGGVALRQRTGDGAPTAQPGDRRLHRQLAADPVARVDSREPDRAGRTRSANWANIIAAEYAQAVADFKRIMRGRTRHAAVSIGAAGARATYAAMGKTATGARDEREAGRSGERAAEAKGSRCCTARDVPAGGGGERSGQARRPASADIIEYARAREDRQG